MPTAFGKSRPRQRKTGAADVIRNDVPIDAWPSSDYGLDSASAARGGGGDGDDGGARSRSGDSAPVGGVVAGGDYGVGEVGDVHDGRCGCLVEWIDVEVGAVA